MSSKASFDKNGNLKVTFGSEEEAMKAVFEKERNREPGVYYCLDGKSITMHTLPHGKDAANDDAEPGGMEARM